MTTDQVYAMFEANGYVKRTAFAVLVGVGDGSKIKAKAIRDGVRVVAFKMNDGLDRAMFYAADASKYKGAPRPQKKDEPLPLMDYADNEAKLRAEYEEYKAWKKANNKDAQ